MALTFHRRGNFLVITSVRSKYQNVVNLDKISRIVYAKDAIKDGKNIGPRLFFYKNDQNLTEKNVYDRADFIVKLDSEKQGEEFLNKIFLDYNDDFVKVDLGQQI